MSKVYSFTTSSPHNENFSFLAFNDLHSKPQFTRGNHETRGIAARSLSKYIDTPTGEYYYSFTYGNTHFVALDCGEDKPDNHQAYMVFDSKVN